MPSGNSDDLSRSAYELLRSQTGRARPANQAGLLACAAFLIAAVLILVAIVEGADLQQLLIGAIALVAANVVAAVIWARAQSRDR